MTDAWLAAALAVAAILLEHALHLGNGMLRGGAMPWLVAAALATFAGVLGASDVVRERRAAAALGPIVLAGIAWQVEQHLVRWPGLYLASPPPPFAFYAGIVVAAIVAVTPWLTFALPFAPRLGHRHFPVFLGVYFLLGVWLVGASPDPKVDVVLHHRESLAALARGADPYALTFPNLYGQPRFFGEGMIVDGRFMYGFGYPPLSLLWAAPAQWIAGDYRYGMLVAMVATAALIGYARPSRIAFAIAALFLLGSRNLFVLEAGWTEPMLLLAVALVVFSAARFPRGLPYAVGLLLASKQYALLGLPAVLVTVWRPRRRGWPREAAIAIAVVLALFVPFLVWDPHAMWRSLVEVHAGMPFRRDALSLPSWWVRRGNEIPPGWLRALPAVALVTAALWRLPRSAAGCAAGIAVTFLCFFVFRQGFANYYYLVAGSLCLAAALAAPVTT